MRIIVLTKNSSYETELQEELQALDHEVLVTRDETMLLDVAKSFQYLFVSETISENEFITLYPKVVSLYEKNIVRLVPTNVPLPSSLKNGMEVVYVQRSFIELRDFLESSPLAEKSEGEDNEILTQQEFCGRLSEREYMLFENLNEKIPISRNELCQKIWGESDKRSKMVQLSGLVRNINKKLETCEFTDKRIKTLWGKGYILQ